MREVNFTHCRSCGGIYPETMLEDLECPDCRGGEGKNKNTKTGVTKGAARVAVRTENKEKTRLQGQARPYQLQLHL